MQVIAQYKPAIPLLHPVDRCGFRHIPVIGRIIPLEFVRCGLRMQADQATRGALDDLKNAVGGAV
jgi:hypothetical protein